MNTAIIRSARWIALPLIVALAAAAGFLYASRSHSGPATARQIAAQFLSSRQAKPGDPIYMKIPAIPGESTAAGHKNWIDLDSWSFGATPGDVSPSLAPITVTMPNSRAVPPLITLLADKTAQTVTLQAAIVAKGGANDFLTITLSGATVTNFSETSHGGRPTDTFTLTYTKINYAYVYTSGGTKTTYTFCWDVNLGRSCAPA